MTTALFLAARSPEKMTSQRCTKTTFVLLLHCEIDPSTPATTAGGTKRKRTAAASSTGSAVGTSASRASQLKLKKTSV
jgi:hypothetical protein